MNMLERAARAICKANGVDPEIVFASNDDGSLWPDVNAVLDLGERTEALAKPCTGWRNWWRILNDHKTDAGYHRRGDVARGLTAYPSKDVAETAARKLMDQFDAQGVSSAAHHEYLGALPEGEVP